MSHRLGWLLAAIITVAWASLAVEYSWQKLRETPPGFYGYFAALITLVGARILGALWRYLMGRASRGYENIVFSFIHPFATRQPLLYALSRAGIFFLWFVALTQILRFFHLSEDALRGIAANTIVGADAGDQPQWWELFGYWDTASTVAVTIFIYDFAPALANLVTTIIARAGVKPDQTLFMVIRRLIRGAAILALSFYLYRFFTNESLTSLLVGLGIGGMAIALAATDSLKNFLGFVTILCDHPFAVGDRVLLAGNEGIVEYIGLRTTRLRIVADSKTVYVPNANVVNDVMSNLGGFHRNGALLFADSTAPEKLREAQTILQNILSDHAGLHPHYPPRVYFSNILPTNFELTFEYWYFGDDEWTYRAFNEQVNWQIVERFRAAGIKFKPAE